MASLIKLLQKKDLMSQAKLKRLKMSPVTFLSNEIFKLEVGFTPLTKLPIFPKNIPANSSKIKQGLQKVSAFAVSKYLMEELTSMKPSTILKNVFLTPLTVTSQISQAKSSYLEKDG